MGDGEHSETFFFTMNTTKCFYSSAMYNSILLDDAAFGAGEKEFT